MCRRVRLMRSRSLRAWCVALAVAAVPVAEGRAQQSFATGQTIAPAYEGWERNDDGAFTLVFGYLNRNWEQVIEIPVGADNSIEPGGPDQGHAEVIGQQAGDAEGLGRQLGQRQGGKKGTNEQRAGSHGGQGLTPLYRTNCLRVKEKGKIDTIPICLVL